ncbi:glyoxylate/hydroxypyruvate reductase HPR3 [Argentina anserina]|uniref:glyoxylate/hydroxypyruvate reductase HPR3 n=1 Tax=Argentina anserina TaxID=57926 RepID=UPI0021761EEC|nr:glyoxylate/hydroxypyruvate reductase HPR3 [Potentilla anserina]
MAGPQFSDAKNDVLSEELPHLLLIHPPSIFSRLPPEFCGKFPVLKAWESPLPLEQFLSTHARSIQALLVRGYLMVNADILEQLPALKLVMTFSVGVNHIDMAECRRRGISVTNAGSAYSEDVADIAVGLYIDVLRKLSAADRYVRQGLWSSKGQYPLGSKLAGKRVGIIGLGSIGSEVAKRLEAFGCIISYNSRREKTSSTYTFYSNVSELAANSDALIICCALTDQTHHMINKEVLASLGREGVIVNVARGAIIDEKELVKCLVSRKIRGAGFDVFENEPQVPEELFALDNVVLSPHTAIFTPESSESMKEVVMANLEAFFLNKPLVSPVVDE